MLSTFGIFMLLGFVAMWAGIYGVVLIASAMSHASDLMRMRQREATVLGFVLCTCCALMLYCLWLVAFPA